MIYQIPYPVPEDEHWCSCDCPFLDPKKEGYDWAYCHFLKKGLMWYDYYLSECQYDYDDQWCKDHPINNECRE